MGKQEVDEMDEEEKDFNTKKPTVALFIIIAAVLIAVLLMEWVFNFFKARM
jgi:hypothetical protein